MKTLHHFHTCEEDENSNEFPKKNKTIKKVLVGLLVIFAGLFMLGFNLGILPEMLRNIIFSWQMLLIAIGIVNISSSDSYVPGIVLICVGGFFLLPKIVIVPFNYPGLVWGFVLILVGLLILTKNKKRTHHRSHQKYTSKLEAGYVEINNVFGGGKEVIAPVEFRGGQIENVFGGVKLDLSQTSLPEGRTILNIESIFGGVEIIVPPEWIVQVRVSRAFGGFADKRQPIQNPDRTRELIITGNTIFGGGEIKSY